MALAEGQVQVRDLVMGPGTDFETLRGFNPWAMAARVDQSSPRSQDHGSWSGTEWRDEMVVPIPLRVRKVGDRSPGGWVTAHQALMAAFAPSHTDIELRWCTGGTEYVMFGRPRVVDPEVDTAPAGYSVTRCAFAAIDPRIYSGVETVANVGLPSSSGGLVWPATPTLLNANPYFESDAAGWAGFGGTISRSTAQAHEGVASGLMTPDGVSSAVQIRSDAVPATPGVTYQAGAWLRSITARTYVLKFRFSGVSADATVVTLAANTWTWSAVTAVAPPGTTDMNLAIDYTGGIPAVSDLLYVDEASVSQLDGGLTWPVTWDAVVSSGVIQVTNAGGVAVRPRLVIYGPVSGPRVTLVDTGQTLAWDVSLAAGQWLDVDTDQRTSLINGQVSRSGQMTSRQWFELPAGRSEIAFNASVFEAGASLTVAYRSAW